MASPRASLFPGATTFPGINRSSFLPPTQDVPFRIERGLFGMTTRGLTVWRTDGVWRQGFIPTAEQVAAADRFYGGGRIHELTPDERDELVAAGFGAYITEEFL